MNIMAKSIGDKMELEYYATKSILKRLSNLYLLPAMAVGE
jgi:hypothetical protein